MLSMSSTGTTSVTPPEKRFWLQKGWGLAAKGLGAGTLPEIRAAKYSMSSSRDSISVPRSTTLAPDKQLLVHRNLLQTNSARISPVTVLARLASTAFVLETKCLTWPIPP